MTSQWLPLFVFAVLTTIESYVPPAIYPWVYVLKAVAITVTLVVFRRDLREHIHPSMTGLLPAIVIGVLVFAEWILLDKWIPYPHLGTRVALDPFATLGHGSVALAAFVVVRFFGLVVLVPIIEELFWRGLALRYLTNPEYRSVPIGTYSWSAFWIVTAASAAAHPEWLVAVVASAAYALLLRHTRSLFAVIVSHGITNAALGTYIVLTGEWQYW